MRSSGVLRFEQNGATPSAIGITRESSPTKREHSSMSSSVSPGRPIIRYSLSRSMPDFLAFSAAAR
jgi:hypothetical protein